MSGHEQPLAPRLPDFRLQVVAAEESGELFFHNGEDSFPVTLRGHVWEMFMVLLDAQLDTTPEHPHQGFRKPKKLGRELSDNPLPTEVAHRIDRLRNKLAAARFGDGRPRDPEVKAFRMDLIETTALGHRLSLAPENITLFRLRDD